MKVNHIVLALAVALPCVVYAHDCPNLMAEIDAALAKKPQIDAQTMSEIRALRIDGESLHAAGEHDESMEALNEALALLGKA